MNTVLESLKLKAAKAELVVIKQDIQQMRNGISTLEVSKQPSNTAGIETMISEALNAQKERQKLNLTIGGLSESSSHVPVDRQKDDEAKLMEYFQSIGAYVLPASVRRFGKMNPDNATKNFSIKPDLGPLQKKGRRELVEKLREKEASVADPEGWKIDYRRWEVVHKPP